MKEKTKMETNGDVLSEGTKKGCMRRREENEEKARMGENEPNFKDSFKLIIFEYLIFLRF